MKTPDYSRFLRNRSYPYFFNPDAPRPFIFGLPVTRKVRDRRRRRDLFGAKKFSPLYGSDRWVNREWPDNWRPFRAKPAAWRREDLFFKFRMAAYR